jgi:hypothetical protein
MACGRKTWCPSVQSPSGQGEECSVPWMASVPALLVHLHASHTCQWTDGQGILPWCSRMGPEASHLYDAYVPAQLDMDVALWRGPGTPEIEGGARFDLDHGVLQESADALLSLRARMLQEAVSLGSCLVILN